MQTEGRLLLPVLVILVMAGSVGAGDDHSPASEQRMSKLTTTVTSTPPFLASIQEPAPAIKLFQIENECDMDCREFKDAIRVRLGGRFGKTKGEPSYKWLLHFAHGESEGTGRAMYIIAQEVKSERTFGIRVLVSAKNPANLDPGFVQFLSLFLADGGKWPEDGFDVIKVPR
ncbi:MAG: hypothetical protein A3A33_01845 [Candidatus Yanofskybacteria bacterium RIFCSPLOWO2_01_FULL_49_25]|uniref:Uncharacterized protein n=1 Tax=Candidatus Yanofskybacteria bacterium RIFCSPLOWO2_01_FULL_49_25 TaxID=1802701 RepID=A0A1F8GWE3_9BACT|nr:MAG: hypothetical protein A3A33_01845 [Candidatus Yanofskybacteria bacterium RIFCSPLOWO2_01_FULL_49_25]